MSQPRFGIWFIGARGGVAATAMVGLGAMKRGLTASTGLVSQLPEFAGLGLAGWDDFVIAGHEIRNVRLRDEAMKLVTESRVLSPALVEACGEELDEIDGRNPAGNGPWSRADDRGFGRRRGSPRGVAAADHRAVAGRPAWLCRVPETGARGRGQRGLDRAAGRRGQPAADLGGAGTPALRPGQMRSAGQFALRDRGDGVGLFLHQFHAFARFGSGGDRRTARASAARVTWAATARRAKRC